VGRLVRGDGVVVPFPFSDLSASKRRPALVVATLSGDDVILCQITSRAIADSNAIPVRPTDFETAGLRRDSNVRPDHLFTADSNIVLYRSGKLTSAKLTEVLATIVRIFSP